MIITNINQLRPLDFKTKPIWEFINNDELGEAAMRPVQSIPVENLNSKLVGTEVLLHNKMTIWALLGNIRSDNPSLTEHLVTASFWVGKKWFTLARYHDPDYEINGPKRLAAMLNLTVDEIFPIEYDVRSLTKGEENALHCFILVEPRVRMSRTELINLAVRKK